MSPRAIKMLLATSLALNIFILGAAAGAGYMWQARERPQIRQILSVLPAVDRHHVNADPLGQLLLAEVALAPRHAEALAELVQGGLH